MSKNPYAKAAATIEGREDKLAKMLSSGRMRCLAPRRNAPGKIVPGREILADLVITRPGPLPFSDAELRRHTVSVRLNSYEMSKLDAQRIAIGGRFKRGEWMRMCWLRARPKPPVPDINWKVREHTARTAANLTQIAAIIDDPEITNQIELASGALDRWRRSLILGVNEEFEREIIIPDSEKAKRHGPDMLPADEVRDQVVSIRLSEFERRKLIHECGSYKQGEWIRMVWKEVKTSGNLRAISESAYKGMIPSAHNINEIARQLNLAVRSDLPDAAIKAKVATIKTVIKVEIQVFRNNVARADESMR